MEQLPAEFLQKLNDREDSIEVKFAPQWNVLEHPATGFFLVCLAFFVSNGRGGI